MLTTRRTLKTPSYTPFGGLDSSSSAGTPLAYVYLPWKWRLPYVNHEVIQLLGQLVTANCMKQRYTRGRERVLTRSLSVKGRRAPGRNRPRSCHRWDTRPFQHQLQCAEMHA